MEDIEIIELYWQRSENAITETSSKYGRQLFSLSQNILKSEEDTEECLNDTYHATWNSIPPKRPQYFFAYLAKIARNFAFGKLDYFKAKKRNAPVVELSVEIENCIPAPDDYEARLENEEIGKAISSFLYSQPKSKRIIFIRRYWYLDSIKDISLNFNISEGKVKSMLFRMRNALRDYLESEGIAL